MKCATRRKHAHWIKGSTSNIIQQSLFFWGFLLSFVLFESTDVNWDPDVDVSGDSPPPSFWCVSRQSNVIELFLEMAKRDLFQCGLVYLLVI
jgi:hypothetical protein